MKNKKTILTAVIATVLVAAMAVGFTLAYLTATTNTVRNKITFVNGAPGEQILAEIVEVWTPAQGLNLLPGDTIVKKPSIKNTSTATSNTDEFVAMQLIYEKIAADGTTTATMTVAEVAKLLSVISLDINTTAWTKDPAATNPNANGVIYFFNTVIAKGASTTDLFTTITVKTTATTTDLSALAAFAPGGFNIRLEGSACQSKNLTFATAQPVLKPLFTQALINS